MLSTLVKEADAATKTIFFIHGNSSSSIIFENVIERSALPYNLIAVDLPGHGKSDHTGKYTWEEMLASLQNTLNSIKGEKLLVGHSLGGHFAIELLPENPSVKGIFIFGTPPLKNPLNIQEAFMANVDTSIFYSEKPETDVLEATISSIITHKGVLKTMKDDFWHTDAQVRTTLAADLGKMSPPLKDEAAIFSTSAIRKYILLTENDPLINSNYIHQLQKEAKYPFEIICLRNCGHYPSLERPDEFYEILKRIAKEVFEK